MKVGYARVSPDEPVEHIEAQLKEFKSFGVDEVFKEQACISMNSGSELHSALRFLRNGDTFVVSRIGRVANSMHQYSILIDMLKNKNVDMYVIELKTDTSTPSGRLSIGIAASVHEYTFSLTNQELLSRRSS
jgi:DNA invertase Pin-like site-specific DNA recombinase